MQETLLTPPGSNGSSPVSSPVKMGKPATPFLGNPPPFPNFEHAPVAKAVTKFTTMDGVKETMQTLREFNVLLMRVIGGSNDEKLEFDLREINDFFEEKTKIDISTVEARRLGIEKLALKHEQLLLNYRTYLRGILDELAKSNLHDELKEIEVMLGKRILPREGYAVSPYRASDISSKEREKQEFPASLVDAWEKVRFLAELKGELNALKTKFSFVEDECPDDEFALEYRKNEAILFNRKFQQHSGPNYQSTEPTIKWQLEEMTRVKKAVAESLSMLKKQMLTIEFLEESESCDLCGRVTAIAEEFEANSTLSTQVATFRRLCQSVQGLKEIVCIENQSEHLRQAAERLKQHQGRVKTFEALKKDVQAMDIGATMNTIQELMDRAVKASNCIRVMFQITAKTLRIFDYEVSQRRSEITSTYM